MADNNLAKARQLAADGKLSDALKIAKSILKADPENEEVHSFLTSLQERMMLDLQIKAILQKSRTYASQGNAEGSKKMAMEVLKIDPANEEALSLSGRRPAELPLAPPTPEESFADLEPDEAAFEAPVVETAQPLHGFQPPSLEKKTAGVQEEESPELETLKPIDLSPEEMPAEKTVLSYAGDLSQEEQKRVREYLDEGQAHFDEGRYQDAISVWTKVFILDEDNADAQEFIDKARDRINARQLEIDPQLAEGIEAYNAGHMEKARDTLEKILTVFPGHREAEYYLDLIRQKEPKPQVSHSHETPSGTSDEFEFLEEAPSPENGREKASLSGSRATLKPNAPLEPDAFTFEDQDTAPHQPIEPTNFVAEENVPANDAEAPSSTGFVLENNASPQSSSFAESLPSEKQSGELPADGDFVLETGAAEDFAVTDQPPKVSEKEKPSDTGGTPATSFNWDEPLPEPSRPAEVPEAPAIDHEAPERVKAKPVPKKSHGSRGPNVSVTVIVVTIVGLLAVALGIFFGTRFFLGRANTPVPNRAPVKQAPIEHPKPKTPPPGAKANSAVPIQPAQLPPTQWPLDKLIAAAGSAYTKGNFSGAVHLYQIALDKTGTANPRVLEGLRTAQAALDTQQLEQQRSAKFMKDFNYSLSSFHGRDYADSLRIAWRLKESASGRTSSHSLKTATTTGRFRT